MCHSVVLTKFWHTWYMESICQYSNYGWIWKWFRVTAGQICSKLLLLLNFTAIRSLTIFFSTFFFSQRQDTMLFQPCWVSLLILKTSHLWSSKYMEKYCLFLVVTYYWQLWISFCSKLSLLNSENHKHLKYKWDIFGKIQLQTDKGSCLQLNFLILN